MSAHMIFEGGETNGADLRPGLLIPATSGGRDAALFVSVVVLLWSLGLALGVGATVAAVMFGRWFTR